MFSPHAGEPRQPPYDVIAETRTIEYAWWHKHYTDAWRRSRDTNTWEDHQLTGIIRATRDAYLTVDSTIEYLNGWENRERKAIVAVKRIQRRRRLKRIGDSIVRYLEGIGRGMWPGLPGSAPR